jgi:hypothetical protein
MVMYHKTTTLVVRLLGVGLGSSDWRKAKAKDTLKDDREVRLASTGLRWNMKK